MHDLDIAFLAGLFPEEYEDEILRDSIGSVQSAANTLQWLIAKGLDENNTRPVKIINSVYVGAFPRRYRRIRVPTFRFEHAPGAQDVNVGFINVFFLKHFFRYFTLRSHLRDWVRRDSNDKVLLAYALTGTFVWCLKYAKRLNPQIETAIVVADLPQYMNTTNRRGSLYTVLKALEILSIRSHMRYVDKFILLTESMHEALGVHQDYVVVEGMVSPSLRDGLPEVPQGQFKTLLYSGGLNQQYGVVRLVEAFTGIADPTYRLLLCGSGDCEEFIAQAAARDERIALLGQLPRQEVLKLQAGATALVNPRQNDSEFTKYSFPSKIMEYLVSGRPVVAYRLDGVPEEYDEHLWYVEDDTVEALRAALIRVCSMDPRVLAERGLAAREFVLREKNPQVQGGRILDLLGGRRNA